MQVRSGRASRRTHQSDHLASLDDLLRGNQRALKMTIARRPALTMVELDQTTVATHPIGDSHPAIRHCPHRRPARRRQIDACMEMVILGDGMSPSTIARGQPSPHRPPPPGSRRDLRRSDRQGRHPDADHPVLIACDQPDPWRLRRLLHARPGCINLASPQQGTGSPHEQETRQDTPTTGADTARHPCYRTALAPDSGTKTGVGRAR